MHDGLADWAASWGEAVAEMGGTNQGVGGRQIN